MKFAIFLLFLLVINPVQASGRFDLVIKGASAELKIENTTNGRAGARIFRNAENCSGGKLYLAEDGLVSAYATESSKIPAGNLVSAFITTSDARIGNSIVSCFVPFSFFPEAGAQYHAYFSTNDNLSCSVRLFRIGKDGGSTPEASFRLREWKTAWSESGSFCKTTAP